MLPTIINLAFPTIFSKFLVDFQTIYSKYDYNNVFCHFTLCRLRTESMSILFCAVLILNITLITCQATTAVPPICENELIEEMPHRIRKVCAALENSNQFAEALNAYIRKEAAGMYVNVDVINFKQIPSVH